MNKINPASASAQDKAIAIQSRAQRFPFPGRIAEGGVLGRTDPDRENQNDEQQKQNQDFFGREHGNNRNKPTYEPKLVMRTYAGDDGVRPLAPNTTFWESPDMWVVAPDGSNIPIAGQVNQVKVHVWNLGLKPAYNVFVELFWCNPSVGINLPAATQIGDTQYIEVLNAEEHKVLSFDWTPEFLNGGHVCLVAQAYSHISDNLVAPFNPLQDCHVAQRNIFQMRVPAGGQVKLAFFAANLSPFKASSEIFIEPLRGELLQTFAQTLGLSTLFAAEGAQAAIVNVRTRQARPTINLAEHPVAAVFRESLEPLPQRFVRSLLGHTLAALPASKVDNNSNPHIEDTLDQSNEMMALSANALIAYRGAMSHAAEILPYQELALTLAIAVPAKAIRGTSFVYRAIERVEGRVTGGITFVVTVD